MALKKKAAVSPTAEETVQATETQAETKIEEKKPVEKKAAPARKKAAPAPEAESAPDVIEDKKPAADEVEQKPEVITQTVVQEVNTATGEVSNVVTLPAGDNQQLADLAETAITTTTASRGIVAQGAQAGFEGLNVGFGSFPILKLAGESFELDDEDYPEKEVFMQISQSRSKYLVKQKDAGDDAEFIYSYNALINGKPNPHAIDVSGSSVQAWIDKQKLASWEVEVKEYIEAIAEIMDDNEFNEEMVLLSIPPSGVRRFSGYCAKLNLKHQCFPDKVITVASIGKKIKREGKSWCPWVFKFHSMLDE